jgi:hypothetical protein
MLRNSQEIKAKVSYHLSDQAEVRMQQLNTLGPVGQILQLAYREAVCIVRWCQGVSFLRRDQKSHP